MGAEANSDSDINLRLVHLESILMFITSSNKDQRKFSRSLLITVNDPLIRQMGYFSGYTGYIVDLKNKICFSSS